MKVANKLMLLWKQVFCDTFRKYYILQFIPPPFLISLELGTDDGRMHYNPCNLAIHFLP